MMENTKEFTPENKTGSVETQELLQISVIGPPDANDRNCDAKNLKTDLRRGSNPSPTSLRPRPEKLSLGERLSMSPPSTQLAGIGHWCHSL